MLFPIYLEIEGTCEALIGSDHPTQVEWLYELSDRHAKSITSQNA